MLKKRRAAADHRRRRRAGAPRRRGGRGAGGQGRGRARRGQGRLERLLRCCTRAASRVGALDLGFVPGEGGMTAADMAEAGALDVLFLLGADEIDVAARRVRRLHRHPWRPRRASRRRDPAGRGLSGEVRHLRQHRRPRADGAARRVPAGRCARGLGDPARAVRHARRTSCPTTRWRSCGRRMFKAHPHLQRIGQIAPGDAADIRKLAAHAAARPTRRRSARRSTIST